MHRVARVQFPAEPENGVGCILVAEEKKVVLGQVQDRLSVQTVLLDVPILENKIGI